MASKQDIIRDKLNRKVFNVIGKSVTFLKQLSPTYNSRGEISYPQYTSSTITIVPYGTIAGEQTHTKFGDMLNGSTDAAVPYNVTIDIDDVIVMEGVSYYVKKVDPNYLPGNVVTIIRLEKTA